MRLHERDAVVDDGVRRHAVEEEQLVGAHTQRLAHIGLDARRRGLREGGDDGVEATAAFDRAHHQLGS